MGYNILATSAPPNIAVVIPSYRVRDHIEQVIGSIGPEVSAIYVVDDKCPDNSGRHVVENVTDDRVEVIFHEYNQGVGGATLTGMLKAAENGADIIVKIDGDGQMDPDFIPAFAGVIAAGEADYAKGNRFFELESLKTMPRTRLIGNAGLSFLAKFSTGYWHVLDPTNGFVAIHASLIPLLPIEKISKRYFFESDILFRLNVISARVVDIPMQSYYGDEVSSMKPMQEIPRFAIAHLRNFAKRIFYNYFVRDFSIASLELFLGIVFTVFGTIYGILNWNGHTPATAGTVMVAALPILIGIQLIIAFFNFDIQAVPRSTLHLRLKASRRPMRSLKRADKLPTVQA